jgi:transposase
MTLARVWARRGSRPAAVKQTQYEWLYVMAAVCPRTGQSIGMLSPYISTEVVNVYLKQFAGELAANVHAALIWDRAGFHKAKELVVPENITIIELPAYSPELNPVENLWQYLRSHYWANRSYGDYDDLRQAACDAWQRVCLTSEMIKSICQADYIERS